MLLVRSFPLPLRPPPPSLGSAANHKAHFEPTVSPRHVCNGCEFSLVTSVSQPADARLALAFGRCRGGRGCRGPAWRLRDGSHLGRGGSCPEPCRLPPSCLARGTPRDSRVCGESCVYVTAAPPRWKGVRARSGTFHRLGSSDERLESDDRAGRPRWREPLRPKLASEGLRCSVKTRLACQTVCRQQLHLWPCWETSSSGIFESRRKRRICRPVCCKSGFSRETGPVCTHTDIYLCIHLYLFP